MFLSFLGTSGFLVGWGPLQHESERQFDNRDKVCMDLEFALWKTIYSLDVLWSVENSLMNYNSNMQLPYIPTWYSKFDYLVNTPQSPNLSSINYKTIMANLLLPYQCHLLLKSHGILLTSSNTYFSLKSKFFCAASRCLAFVTC